MNVLLSRARRRALQSLHVPARSSSSGIHFYRNRQLEVYASKPANRLSLRQLVFFGRSMNEERIIKSANYVREELPVRIAHRIRDLQALPYVVVTQEWIAKVYELYWTAFEKFRSFPAVITMEDNERFCEFLTGLLTEHSNVIPYLFLGLTLSSPHLLPEQLDSFMQRMLVSRVSRRVLAEHHISLTNALAKRDSEAEGDHVGVIYTQLSVAESVQRCWDNLQALGSIFDVPTNATSTFPDDEVRADDPIPRLVVDGHIEARFSYIKDHLDYIIFELLKNSIRFSRLHARATMATAPPVIRVTIGTDPDNVHVRISDNGGGIICPEVTSPSDLYSFSHIRNATRMNDDRIGALRDVSSRDSGLRATVAEQIRALTVPGSTTPFRPMPRIGLGLPMSNMYANYFGGGLDLMSLDGWGTDAYVRLPKLGTNLEGIEV